MEMRWIGKIHPKNCKPPLAELSSTISMMPFTVGKRIQLKNLKNKIYKLFNKIQFKKIIFITSKVKIKVNKLLSIFPTNAALVIWGNHINKNIIKLLLPKIITQSLSLIQN